MNTKEYKCYECNKIYTKYNSMWNHNKKYHTIIISPLKCKYCDKVYKHLSSKSRHEKTCNGEYINKDTDNKLINVINENNELKNIINELKHDIDKIKINIKKDKTIINNNNNNNNTTNNTTNNTLNNNNINNVYVRFDNFSYDDFLTKKEIKEILQERFMAIEKSIKKIHFNPNNEEYNNIYINNLEGKYAYVYDGGDKFIVMDKDTFLDKLIDNHISEIDKYKHLVENDKKTSEKINELVTDIIDDDKPFVYGDKTYKNYCEFKKEGINLLIFNNTDKLKFNKINKIKLIEKDIDI